MRVWLYDEGSESKLDVDTIARRIEGELQEVHVAVRGEFNRFHLDSLQDYDGLDRLAQKLASARLSHPKLRTANARPLWSEVIAERRLLENPQPGSDGAMYVGYEFQSVLRSLLLREESRRDCLHVIYTNRLMTYWWDDDDCYYGSTVVCGNPSIVSLSGCLEGPGNPEALYTELRELGNVTRDDPRYKDLLVRFRDRMLDYSDDRITDVATAMTWQAIFYHFFGVAFCEDPSCRLFNAHWQEEMLRAVLPEGGKLCDVHAKLLADAQD